MTIAAGFCYGGGILLCADTEHTGLDNKLYSGKISHFGSPSGKFAFAYAGNAAVAISVIQKCERVLRGLSDGDAFLELESIIDTEYRRNVLTHPEYNHATLDYQLLISVCPPNGGATLWATKRTAIRRIDFYECMGIGESLAHYILRPDLLKRLNERKILTLATYMLACVKSYVPGCGGISQFLWMRNDGAMRDIYSTVGVGLDPRTGTEWLEKHAKGYELLTRQLMYELADPGTSDSDFEANLTMFAGRILELRRSLRASNLIHESFQYIGNDSRPRKIEGVN